MLHPWCIGGQLSEPSRDGQRDSQGGGVLLGGFASQSGPTGVLRGAGGGSVGKGV